MIVGIPLSLCRAVLDALLSGSHELSEILVVQGVQKILGSSVVVPCR